MPIATIDVLKANPLKFLQTFPIKIAYNKSESAVIQQYHYGQKSGVLYFNNGFANVDDPQSAEVTRAHGVVAARGAPNFYELTNESDLMLTTQLSGCCIVLDDSDPNAIKIAHVRPDADSDGIALQESLNDYPKRFGKQDYIDNYCYVLGVRTQGWRFYAQRRLQDQRHITDAREIFV